MTGWRVHAGVLMGNHSHLLGEPPEANLGAGMQWLQNIYTLFDKSGRRPMVFFCQRDHFVVFFAGLCNPQFALLERESKKTLGVTCSRTTTYDGGNKARNFFKNNCWPLAEQLQRALPNYRRQLN